MKHDQEAQVVKKSAAIPSTNHSAAPLLALVIPCYNEEAMLHITLPELWKKLDELIKAKLISDKSFALYVNDGSTDHTWEILSQAAEEDPQRVGAISLSLIGGIRVLCWLGYFTPKTTPISRSASMRICRMICRSSRR